MVPIALEIITNQSNGTICHAKACANFYLVDGRKRSQSNSCRVRSLLIIWN
ncbi:hypothetical protein [Nostoc sp.]|uniref:hypothetical protein n=1 Tax=Nostoc sp. TaxID=1180 RepID=UPI002FF9151D